MSKKKYFKLIGRESCNPLQLYFIKFEQDLPENSWERKHKELSSNEVKLAICYECNKTRYAIKQTNWSSCEC